MHNKVGVAWHYCIRENRAEQKVRRENELVVIKFVFNETPKQTQKRHPNTWVFRNNTLSNQKNSAESGKKCEEIMKTFQE